MSAAVATTPAATSGNGRVAAGPLFASMWGGGFDSIAPLVRLDHERVRLDLVEATEHDTRIDQDYRFLDRMGLRWTREDVRWHRCEPEPGRYDFKHLEPVVRTAQEHQIEVVWSWMHYGCPAFVDPLDTAFPEQIAALGARHLEWLRQHGVEPVAIAPINEPSYFTWHVETHGSWYPFGKGEGGRLKTQLLAAHRRCYERIKQVAPRTVVLLIDPFYYPIGREDDPGSLEEAEFWRNAAFEAIDRVHEHVDVLGMNFYADGQVECYWDPVTRRYERRMLPLGDPRRISLPEALRVYGERYGPKPVIVSETSVRAGRRLPWLTYLTEQAVLAIDEGLPLAGLCWYPVLDVPDWGLYRRDRALQQLRIAHSGLIRLERSGGVLRRVMSPEVVQTVRLQETRLHQAIQQVLHAGEAEHLPARLEPFVDEPAVVVANDQR